MKRILALLFAMVFLCACIPTPEQDVVINRGEEDTEALIQTTPAPDTVPIAQAAASALLEQEKQQEAGVTVMHMDETYPLGIGDAQMVFAADVTVPNLENWSIYAVQKAQWDKDGLKTFLLTVADGQPVYQEWDTVTKEYLAEAIVAAENSEKVRKQDEVFKASGEKTRVELLMQDYESAPNSITRTPIDWDNVPFDGSLFCSIWREDIRAYWNVLYFDGRLEFNAFDQLIQNEDLVRQGEYVGANPGRELTHLSLSREEAQEKAEALFQSVGIADVTLAEDACRKAQRVNQYTSEVQSEGWQLVYRKNIDGIAGIAPRNHELGAVDESFGAGFPQETVTVYVDSVGIWQLLWSGRCEIKEQLSDSTALLDFDDAMTLIKSRLRIENTHAADMGTKTIRVTDITLGYCIVSQKDAQDAGYTLPVWVVNYEVDASFAPATLYFGFAISALNGANIHLE